MAEGLNRVTLIGNLGQDPELRHTQGGQAVMTLRLATTETWQQDGERKERTDWHTLVMWGKRAEALANVLTKGSRMCAEGRLQYRSWEDQQGNKRTAAEVVLTNVTLLGGGSQRYDDRAQPNRKADGKGTGGRSGAPKPARGYDPESGDQYPSDHDGFDDDIPFIRNELHAHLIGGAP